MRSSFLRSSCASEQCLINKLTNENVIWLKLGSLVIGGGQISRRRRDLFFTPPDLSIVLQTSPGSNPRPRNLLRPARSELSAGHAYFAITGLPRGGQVLFFNLMTHFFLCSLTNNKNGNWLDCNRVQYLLYWFLSPTSSRDHHVIQTQTHL